MLCCARQGYCWQLHQNSPFLPPEHFDRRCRALEGMCFDIPKSIDLRPTRTLLDWLPLMGEEKGL